MKDIKIYTTSTCHFCKVAKEYFTSKNIPFEAVDINSNKDELDRFIGAGHRSVPVIEIGDTTIVGWDQAKVEAALS